MTIAVHRPHTVTARIDTTEALPPSSSPTGRAGNSTVTRLA
ncbi:hypothetical protein ABZ864_47635 [Streptomyces sp. NPDC047082]